MTAVRFPVEIRAGLTAQAREELLERGGSPAEAPFRFGYLLGVELEELPGLPAVALLERLLRVSTASTSTPTRKSAATRRVWSWPAC